MLFQFTQTCTCKFGGKAHTTCYVGATFHKDFEVCGEVPTGVVGWDSLNRELGDLCSALAILSLGDVPAAAGQPPLRCLPTEPQAVGIQRTPDSLLQSNSQTELSARATNNASRKKRRVKSKRSAATTERQ